jgi:two-component system, NtrC family, sensor kinase
VQASFPSPISSVGIHSRVVRSGEPVFRYDIEAEADVPQPVRDLARAGGYRSILVVPMMRGSKAIGTIGVTRPKPGPFSNGQIALLKSFAAQAVIAIENARLFEAEQHRTRELTEALEYQTATSEVLNVISRSPADARPVFDAIVESATRLCDAVFSVVYRYDNERLRIAATKNFTAEATNQIYERQELQRPNRTFVGGRAVVVSRIFRTLV